MTSSLVPPRPHLVPDGVHCPRPSLIGDEDGTGSENDLSSSLRAELSRRFAEQIEEARKKRFVSNQARAQFARNRRYGLAKRHALKEERTK